MRLAMQQLLVSPAVGDGGRQTLYRLDKKRTVRVAKLWCADAVAEQQPRPGNSIGEVLGRDLDLPHAGVQPQKRPRIRRRGDCGGQGFVVGPKRDSETVTQMDTRLHPEIEDAHRATRLGQASGDLNFEFGACLVHPIRHSGEYVAR
jgi:hypothetical protein